MPRVRLPAPSMKAGRCGRPNDSYPPPICPCPFRRSARRPPGRRDDGLDPRPHRHVEHARSVAADHGHRGDRRSNDLLDVAGSDLPRHRHERRITPNPADHERPTGGFERPAIIAWAAVLDLRRHGRQALVLRQRLRHAHQPPGHPAAQELAGAMDRQRGSGRPERRPGGHLDLNAPRADVGEQHDDHELPPCGARRLVMTDADLEEQVRLLQDLLGQLERV